MAGSRGPRLYTADESWAPVALVADFGTFSHATSGVKTITGLSQAVTGQTRYLVAFVADGQFRVTASLSSPVLGGLNGNTAGVGYYAAMTYATLPSTPVAPTTFPGYNVMAAVQFRWTTT